MAISVSIAKYYNPAVDYRIRVADVTFDDSYPSGGYSLSASDFGLNGIICVQPLGQLDGYVCMWDRANSKLKIFQSAGSAAPLAELSNGADLSNKKVTVKVEGY